MDTMGKFIVLHTIAFAVLLKFFLDMDGMLIYTPSNLKNIFTLCEGRDFCVSSYDKDDKVEMEVVRKWQNRRLN
jgi:hypothetical protein